MISIVFGDFDTHSNQVFMHQSRMQELNAGLQAFYTTLRPNFADRTLLVGTSEFGRRVKENSNGTDHGAANSLFAIGSRVNGGFHGQMPSLTNLDQNGNLRPTVDYRHFYSNVVTQWFGADSAQVLGRDYGNLGFLKAPGTTPTTTSPTVPATTPTTTNPTTSNPSTNKPTTSNPTTSKPTNSPNPTSPSSPSPTKLAPVPLALPIPAPPGVPTPTSDPAIPVIDGSGNRGQRAQVARLYLAYFLRDPDEAGYEMWVDVRQAGASLPQISSEFVASPEFQRRYGSLSHRQFVELVYKNVLGRQPDAKGLAHWTGVLNNGGSRGSVMVGFSESPEFKKRTARQIAVIENNGPIGRLYMAYFLRRPDEAGKEYWLNTGLPTKVVSEQFAASSEFVRRYGALSNAAFVRLAYRNVLGRPADAEGLTHWVSLLNQSTTRGAVMQGFSDSPEFVRRVKNL